MYKIDRKGGGAQKSYTRTDPMDCFNLFRHINLRESSHEKCEIKYCREFTAKTNIRIRVHDLIYATFRLIQKE